MNRSQLIFDLCPQEGAQARRASVLTLYVNLVICREAVRIFGVLEHE